MLEEAQKTGWKIPKWEQIWEKEGVKAKPGSANTFHVEAGKQPKGRSTSCI